MFLVGQKLLVLGEEDLCEDFSNKSQNRLTFSSLNNY